MATKDQVIQLHQQNPNWNSVDIADELKCRSEYVRATAKRYGLNLAKRQGMREPYLTDADYAVRSSLAQWAANEIRAMGKKLNMRDRHNYEAVADHIRTRLIKKYERALKEPE